MADPVTLAVVGATAGAVLNPNDPVKGAVIGGSLGYGGGALSAMGAAEAAPIVNASYASGAPFVEGLTAQQVSTPAFVPTLLGGPASTFESMVPSNVGSFGSVGSGGFGNSAGTTGLLSGTSSSSTLSPLQKAWFGSRIAAMGQPQQSRPLPRAPQIQSRPYTGMKLPVNQEEDMKRRMMIPPVPQISLL